MKITNDKLSLNFDENTLSFNISANGTEWQTKTDFSPFIKTTDKIIYFKEASVISHKEVITGVGKGILSRFEGYESGIVFETFVWIENTTNDMYFEWMPIEEGSTSIDYICWPGEFEFSKDSSDWYTLLPKQQDLTVDLVQPAPTFHSFHRLKKEKVTLLSALPLGTWATMLRIPKMAGIPR